MNPGRLPERRISNISEHPSDEMIDLFKNLRFSLQIDEACGTGKRDA
jgi:hypothetical protein